AHAHRAHGLERHPGTGWRPGRAHQQRRRDVRRQLPEAGGGGGRGHHQPRGARRRRPLVVLRDAALGVHRRGGGYPAVARRAGRRHARPGPGGRVPHLADRPDGPRRGGGARRGRLRGRGAEGQGGVPGQQGPGRHRDHARRGPGV
ncbi:MAG: Organic hydroperoxide resistance protein, partial [uncultured Pseudonocardia sp.]